MSDQSLNENELPFSSRAQKALLGHLMTNSVFFLAARDRVRPEWFADAPMRQLWTLFVKFCNAQGGQLPRSEDDFFESFNLMEVKVRNTLQAQYRLALHERQFFSGDHLIPKLTEWMKVQVYKEAMNKSIELFNQKRTRDAYGVIREGMIRVDEVRFDDAEEDGIENWESMLQKSNDEIEGALTFGHPVMDRLLMPDSHGGCLLKGDTTLLLAPSNIGKSTVMISVIAANLLRDRDILWLSHEDRPDRLKMKMICAMTKLREPEVRRAPNNPVHKRYVDIVSQIWKKHLTYIPLNKAGLTVEEIDTLLRRKIEEKKAKTGRGYDMLVDDYPAKLFTQKASKGHMAMRHINDIVYNYFVQWALEFHWHSLVAIQANREAARINRRQKDEDRLLTPEDVSEAYGPVQTASTVISINRDPLCQATGRVIYGIGKSRSSETGYAVACQGDWGRSIAHRHDMPAIHYRGTSNMSGKLDDLLKNYANREVPDDIVTDEEGPQ